MLQSLPPLWVLDFRYVLKYSARVVDDFGGNIQCVHLLHLYTTGFMLDQTGLIMPTERKPMRVGVYELAVC